MASETSAHNACLVKRILCCVYDKRARMWGDIFSCPNCDVAARTVESLVSRSGSVYHDYPSDFALYQIGSTIEPESGLEIIGQPITLLYEFNSFVEDSYE